MSNQLNVEAFVDVCVLYFKERGEGCVAETERDIVCLTCFITFSFLLGNFNWMDSLALGVSAYLKHPHARLEIVQDSFIVHFVKLPALAETYLWLRRFLLLLNLGGVWLNVLTDFGWSCLVVCDLANIRFSLEQKLWAESTTEFFVGGVVPLGAQFPRWSQITWMVIFA